MSSSLSHDPISTLAWTGLQAGDAIYWTRIERTRLRPPTLNREIFVTGAATFLIALPVLVVFGALLWTTACYFGLNTTGGTEGVGQSTTRTVVLSSILILVVDYFLTQMLLSVLTP